MSQQTELARPFPSRYVKKNPSGYGDYVAHHIVNQRLIEVLGSAPSFEVKEIIRGDTQDMNDVAVGVVAEMTALVDGVTVRVSEVGDCENPGNWPHDGARLKDAASDAFKRCAMRFGCGLSLWSGDSYFLYDHLKSAGSSGNGATEASRPSSSTAPAAGSPQDSGAYGVNGGRHPINGDDKW